MLEKNWEEAENPLSPAPLTIEDLDQVYQLDQICFPGEVAFPKDFFFYLLTSPDCLGFGIKKAGKLLGFIIVQAQSPTRAQLITLDIAPEHRRKGLGSFLLYYVHQYLKERGFKRIRLEVAYNNQPALNLYQKFGYQWRGQKKKYYPDGTDAIIMEKLL